MVLAMQRTIWENASRKWKILVVCLTFREKEKHPSIIHKSKLTHQNLIDKNQRKRLFMFKSKATRKKGFRDTIETIRFDSTLLCKMRKLSTLKVFKLSDSSNDRFSYVKQKIEIFTHLEHLLYEMVNVYSIESLSSYHSYRNNKFALQRWFNATFAEMIQTAFNASKTCVDN